MYIDLVIIGMELEVNTAGWAGNSAESDLNPDRFILHSYRLIRTYCLSILSILPTNKEITFYYQENNRPVRR